MSTIRIVATAFRWIIEIMNVLFALFLVLMLVIYFSGAGLPPGPLSEIGYSTGLGFIASLVLVALAYIIGMGFLCVVLEIWQSLRRLEKAREAAPTGVSEPRL